MTPFFDTTEIHETLKLNAKIIRTLEGSTDFQRERNAHCLIIINSMIKNPQQWDSLTPFNINNIGGFISIRLVDDTKSEEDIDSYFATLFRFLMEFYFYQNADFNYDFLAIKNFALNNQDTFGSEAQRQIFYTLNEMPFSLMRFKFNSDDIQYFIKAVLAEKSMEALINGWDSKIALHTAKVEGLKEKLDEQENAYNFVGLYSGFDLLSQNKIKESNNAFFFTFFLGVLALLPLGLDVFLVYKGVVKVESIYSLFTLLPAFTLTFIFIYYFKISLSNYQSVKSQVNQMELRKTLCRFIQKYTEYAKEMKVNDKECLDKFETIIFSNIMPSADQIPSTFDGIEQLAKLIESVRGK